MTVSDGAPNYFGRHVETGVRRFQMRHGLEQSGVVDRVTRGLLNVSARRRLAILQVNRDRMLSMKVDRTRPYVVVNIASAELEAVRDGAVEQRHKVVVGRTYRRTPQMNSEITHIDFNPNWYVPQSIARWDVIPQARRDPSYLKANRFLVYRRNGKEDYRVDPNAVDWDREDAHIYYRFVQLAGAQNSLGQAIIRFPNSKAIFLHDTPEKHHFADAMRMNSSGCVRVENIVSLAEWLLQNTEKWPATRVESIQQSRKMARANLASPVPVHLVYVTAWAGTDGTMRFRNDLYRYDQAKIQRRIAVR
jgi:murein L,D-transpeptidase YcbB/YkuD